MTKVALLPSLAFRNFTVLFYIISNASLSSQSVFRTMAPLWSSSLISSEVVTSLPEGYQARPLERNDFSKGYLDCLRVLTHVGELTEEKFHERYDEMSAINGVKPTYYLVVIEHQEKIVGTGSLIVERKL
jgi:glucosamine-phosphate N-acetyltransferase